MDKDIEATIEFMTSDGYQKAYLSRTVAVMGHSNGADAALTVASGMNTEKLNINAVLALEPCAPPTAFSKVDTYLQQGTVNDADRKLLCGQNNDFPDLYNYMQQSNSTMNRAYVSGSDLPHNSVITASSPWLTYITGMLGCSLSPNNVDATANTGTTD